MNNRRKSKFVFKTISLVLTAIFLVTQIEITLALEHKNYLIPQLRTEKNQKQQEKVFFDPVIAGVKGIFEDALIQTLKELKGKKIYYRENNKSMVDAFINDILEPKLKAAIDKTASDIYDKAEYIFKTVEIDDAVYLMVLINNDALFIYNIAESYEENKTILNPIKSGDKPLRMEITNCTGYYEIGSQVKGSINPLFNDKTPKPLAASALINNNKFWNSDINNLEGYDQALLLSNLYAFFLDTLKSHDKNYTYPDEFTDYPKKAFAKALGAEYSKTNNGLDTATKQANAAVKGSRLPTFIKEIVGLFILGAILLFLTSCGGKGFFGLTYSYSVSFTGSGIGGATTTVQGGSNQPGQIDTTINAPDPSTLTGIRWEIWDKYKVIIVDEHSGGIAKFTDEELITIWDYLGTEPEKFKKDQYLKYICTISTTVVGADNYVGYAMPFNEDGEKIGGVFILVDPDKPSNQKFYSFKDAADQHLTVREAQEKASAASGNGTISGLLAHEDRGHLRWPLYIPKFEPDIKDEFTRLHNESGDDRDNYVSAYAFEQRLEVDEDFSEMVRYYTEDSHKLLNYCISKYVDDKPLLLKKYFQIVEYFKYVENGREYLPRYEIVITQQRNHAGYLVNVEQLILSGNDEILRIGGPNGAIWKIGDQIIPGVFSIGTPPEPPPISISPIDTNFPLQEYDVSPDIIQQMTIVPTPTSKFIYLCPEGVKYWAGIGSRLIVNRSLLRNTNLNLYTSRDSIVVSEYYQPGRYTDLYLKFFGMDGTLKNEVDVMRNIFSDVIANQFAVNTSYGITADINGNFTMAINLKTYSSRDNPTSLSRSFLVFFDKDGNLLKRQEISGMFEFDISRNNLAANDKIFVAGDVFDPLKLSVIDLKTGWLIDSIRLDVTPSEVQISPDGNYIFIMSTHNNEPKLYIYDRVNKNMRAQYSYSFINQILTDPQNRGVFVVYSPGLVDGAIDFINTTDPANITAKRILYSQELFNPYNPFTSEIISITADGRYIFASLQPADGKLRILDITNLSTTPSLKGLTKDSITTKSGETYFIRNGISPEGTPVPVLIPASPQSSRINDEVIQTMQ